MPHPRTSCCAWKERSLINRLTSRHLRFTTDTIHLEQAKNKHQIINLINTGKKNVSITSIFKPDYLEVDCTPPVLHKGMTGNLIIRYLPKHAGKIKPDDHLLIKTDQGTTHKFMISNK